RQLRQQRRPGDRGERSRRDRQLRVQRRRRVLLQIPREDRKSEHAGCELSVAEFCPTFEYRLAQLLAQRMRKHGDLSRNIARKMEQEQTGTALAIARTMQVRQRTAAEIRRDTQTIPEEQIQPAQASGRT